MSKVYGLFYTRTGNVLCGYGGKVGGHNRVGAQLPGGSATGKKDAQEITIHKIRKTLLDELDEEFGVNARKLLEAEIDLRNPEPYSKILDGHNVYIVFCEISNDTAAACCGFVTDAKKRRTFYDEPFTRVAAVNIQTAYEKEIDAGNTWFKEAVLALAASHFNGVC